MFVLPSAQVPQHTALFSQKVRRDLWLPGRRVVSDCNKSKSVNLGVLLFRLHSLIM